MYPIEETHKTPEPKETSTSAPSSEPSVAPSVLPREVAEMVDKLPGPVKQSIELSMVSMLSGRNNNPIVQKLTPEHITKFLDYTQEDDFVTTL